MISIISSAFFGALIGFGVCLIIYLLSAIGEALHGVWQFVSCGFDYHSVIPVWTKSTFFHIAVFCVVAGILIGIIYGIITEIQLKRFMDEEAKSKRAQKEAEQRKKFANDLKREVSNKYKDALNNLQVSTNNEIGYKSMGLDEYSFFTMKMNELEMRKIEIDKIIDDYKIV